MRRILLTVLLVLIAALLAACNGETRQYSEDEVPCSELSEQASIVDKAELVAWQKGGSPSSSSSSSASLAPGEAPPLVPPVVRAVPPVLALPRRTRAGPPVLAPRAAPLLRAGSPRAPRIRAPVTTVGIR